MSDHRIEYATTMIPVEDALTCMQTFMKICMAVSEKSFPDEEDLMIEYGTDNHGEDVIVYKRATPYEVRMYGVSRELFDKDGPPTASMH